MKLKELRKKVGFTQQQVANKLGISRVSYQNYELNRRQPDMEMQVKLADFFHCSLDELAERKNCEFINLTMLDDAEREVIENIRKLNHDNLLKVASYIESKLEDQNK